MIVPTTVNGVVNYLRKMVFVDFPAIHAGADTFFWMFGYVVIEE